jgi:hypothetical protein
MNRKIFSARTRDKLKNLGKKGDTYDEIINSLLLTAERNKIKEEFSS